MSYSTASIVRILFFAASSMFFLTGWSNGSKKKKPEFYYLTVYKYQSVQQEQLLDSYFKNAYIPALHRFGFNKVGVFKGYTNDTAAIKTLYVLVPVNNLNAIAAIENKLLADAEYEQAGAAYLTTDYKNAAYSRKEVILLKAFSLAPQMQVPALKADKKDRVYELRSYESASEKIFKNKVHMFNEGDEIGIFKKLNFNAVFYSEVIAGGKMPNLMYMTSFESMEDRNAHWKNFGSDSSWKKLSGMQMYQNNVSHIDIVFLHGAAYSDF